MKLIRNKWFWLLLFNSLACFALYVLPSTTRLQYWLNASHERLLLWYPHFGTVVYYVMWLYTPLRFIMLCLAIAGWFYFIITTVPPLLKRVYGKLTERTLQFKLLSALIVGLLLVKLFSLAAEVKKAPGMREYNMNDSINQRNNNYSKGNSFGFTDIERKPAKPKGVYRIAVLGDSFVWGDGVPYEQAWSHKLERMLLQKYDSIEVLHWGRCGWSTKDEMNFFVKHGKDFDVDLLIMGWVDNDPDLGNYKGVNALDLAKEYPVIYAIYPVLARRLANAKEQDLAARWYLNLYSRQNLQDYEKLLKDFKDTLANHKVDVFAVITPVAIDESNGIRFDTIEHLMNRVDLKCINLFGSIRQKFRAYPKGALWANPVNPHPGTLLTDEYAAVVMDTLQKGDYLKELHRR